MRLSLSHAASFCLLLWALGALFGEGLSQAALFLGFGLSAFSPLRKNLHPRLKTLLTLMALLATWQALSVCLPSPFPWPRSGRYTQFVNTLAPGVVVAVAALHVPWRALWWTLGIGWTLNFLVGLYQHYFTWTYTGFPFSHSTVERVQEVFSKEGVERHGAGGLVFHRLRFSHGAVAFLGPFLTRALSLWHSTAMWPWAVVTVQLALVSYFAFARAATLTTFFLLGVAGILFLQTRVKWAVATGAVCAFLALAVSPVFSARLLAGVQNLFDGERRLAMTAGWRILQEHALFGVGFGRHQAAALATGLNITPYLANDSHNLWLTTWAETGVVGFLLLFALHLQLGVMLFQAARNHDLFAQGAFLSFIGFHLLSWVHYLPYHSGVHLSFAWVWGLGLLTYVRRESSHSVHHGINRRTGG